MRRSVLLVFLILAACTGDGETVTTTVAPPVLTTLGDAAPPTTASATTSPTATSTTTTTTTTLAPANAAADFGLTQVVFGDSSFVVITNWGNAAGNLAGYWLNQGTLYKLLPDIELAPGEQTLLGLARVSPPELAGMAVTLFLGPTIGVLEATSGEVALYANSPFTDPDSIVAYVEWGEAGHPSAAVAIDTGIWSDSAVEVFDDAPSISSGIHPVTSSTDWFADVGG